MASKGPTKITTAFIFLWFYRFLKSTTCIHCHTSIGGLFVHSSLVSFWHWHQKVVIHWLCQMKTQNLVLLGHTPGNIAVISIQHLSEKSVAFHMWSTHRHESLDVFIMGISASLRKNPRWYRFALRPVGSFGMPFYLLWMEEILHHLGWLQPYK